MMNGIIVMANEERDLKMQMRPLQVLVGGFSPVEKYSSKWESSSSTGENTKICETTTT